MDQRHESAILNETHEVSAPLTLGGVDGMFGVHVPTNVTNPLAGMLFSKNTCSGCHIINTMTANFEASTFQVSVRNAGEESKLSPFLTNASLCGDFGGSESEICLFPYTQNDLARRKTLFERNLQGIGFSKVAARELKLKEPADWQVITEDSKIRVH